MQQVQSPHRRRRRRRRFKAWMVIVPLAVALLMAYPFWEARQLTVDEHELYVSGLPQNLKNVEIVFASDFHHQGSMAGSQAERAITMINNLSADVVILGGDYAGSTEEAISFFEALPGIWARMGVYAVLGDKEYTNPDRVNELLGVMTGRGIIPLVNTTANVKVGQNHIVIAGIADANAAYPDAAGIASSVSEEEFVIAVSHSPDAVIAMQKAYTASGSSHWYDLALFGHTHGGQVNLFGFTPFSGLRPITAGNRYMQGWLEENRAGILTSNGIGTEYLPVRAGAKPTLHVITLKERN